MLGLPPHRLSDYPWLVIPAIIALIAGIFAGGVLTVDLLARSMASAQAASRVQSVQPRVTVEEHAESDEARFARLEEKITRLEADEKERREFARNLWFWLLTAIGGIILNLIGVTLLPAWRRKQDAERRRHRQETRQPD